MEKITIADALHRLKPNSEFTYENEDYSTIRWDVLQGEAPTQAEVDTTIELLGIERAEEETNKAALKESAQAKLAALGLSEEEISALGL